MNDLFLDTVGLLALWDEDDQWHAVASASFAQPRSGPTRLFTTRFVLAECGNALARTGFRAVVGELEQALNQSNGLLEVSTEDWSLAMDRYSGGFSGAAGLVDEISFQAMRRRGIRKAFTNDRHFVAAGLEILF